MEVGDVVEESPSHKALGPFMKGTAIVECSLGRSHVYIPAYHLEPKAMRAMNTSFPTPMKCVRRRDLLHGIGLNKLCVTPTSMFINPISTFFQRSTPVEMCACWERF